MLNNNFPFTMDQGRDMLDLRSIVEGRHLRLIGPTTSINGVFLGPFYYYFNLLPYLIGQGDPSYLVYWNIMWYVIAPLVLFFLLRKNSVEFSYFTAIIFLMAPAFFYSSRYFWSANPMPYFTLFYLLTLYFYLQKPDFKTAVILGLISGLSMQIEAAFGILFLPFAIILSLVKLITIPEKKRMILGLALITLSFGTTLLPQIFFELRHSFVMTHTFLNEINGQSAILGEKLNLFQIITSHFQSFVDTINGPFELPGVLTRFIFLISIIFVSHRIFQNKTDKTVRQFFYISMAFLIYAFIFYLTYAHPLKDWYLSGLRLPFIFIFAAFFTEIYRLKKALLTIPLFLIIFASFFNTTAIQRNFLPKNISDRSGDKSNLRNEIEAIDWVYGKANLNGFKVYNYIPSVYDYPYQYLFWWYGTNKYGYQPDVLTYKNNVPEYIENNNSFFTKKKPATKNSPIFLIYEKDENPARLTDWLGNFSSLCPVEIKKYPWETTVEIRKECVKNLDQE